MNATEPYARPGALRRGQAALAVGWAGLLAHAVLIFLATFTITRHQRGNAFIGLVYVLLLTAALVLIPIGARLLRDGRDDGRLFITGAGVAPLPFLLVAATAGLLWALPRLATGHGWYVHSWAKAYLAWSALPAAVGAVGLLMAVLYLWQPGVTAYLRSPLSPGRMPHPKAPGEW